MSAVPMTHAWGDDDQQAAKLMFRSAGVVKPEWIDYNGHMNVAYYVLAFDEADDQSMYRRLNLTDSFRQRTQMSTMTAEAHIRYLSEVVEGEVFRCYSQLVDYDTKRWHEIQYMVRGDTPDGDDPFLMDPTSLAKEDLVATHEVMALSVDLSSRRVSPWHEETLDRLHAVWQEHKQLSKPDWLGKTIGIPAEKSLARR